MIELCSSPTQTLMSYSWFHDHYRQVGERAVFLVTSDSHFRQVAPSIFMKETS
jgi:hypothetical protein